MTKKQLCLRILAALIALLTIAYLAWLLHDEAIWLAKNPVAARDWVRSFGAFGILVVFAMQVLQIVIPALPGEIVQMLSGYVYGSVGGTIILFFGSFVGTIIAFYLARLFGYPLVSLLTGKFKFDKFTTLLQHRRATAIIFIWFLLPGVPKDILVFAGGLLPINPRQFIISTTIARLPWMIVSAYLGSNIQQRDYSVVIITIAIVALLTLSGYLFKDKVLRWFDR